MSVHVYTDEDPARAVFQFVKAGEQKAVLDLGAPLPGSGCSVLSAFRDATARFSADLCLLLAQTYVRLDAAQPAVAVGRAHRSLRSLSRPQLNAKSLAKQAVPDGEGPSSAENEAIAPSSTCSTEYGDRRTMAGNCEVQHAAERKARWALSAALETAARRPAAAWTRR